MRTRRVGGAINGKMAAETEKREKRRSWGKSRHREKIAIIDRMEVEEPLKQVHLPHTAAKSDEIDLQHPEFIRDEQLIEALSRLKVPIPVHSGGEPSREQLIDLFRRHVTPKPQREQSKGREWHRRRRKGEAVMEVDVPLLSHQDDIWSSDSGSSWSDPLVRKRWGEF